jgi:hypothetical protein
MALDKLFKCVHITSLGLHNQLGFIAGHIFGIPLFVRHEIRPLIRGKGWGFA